MSWTIRKHSDAAQYLEKVANAASERKWTADRAAALEFRTRGEAQRALYFEDRYAPYRERVAFVNDPSAPKSSTNTTCQICARPIEAGTGLIAHHGYRRPKRGSGWQTGSCMGARHKPYERSCDLLPVAIQACRNTVAAVERRIAKWLASPPAEIVEARNPQRRESAERRFPRPEGFDSTVNEQDVWGSWRANAPRDYEAPGWAQRHAAYEAYGSRFFGALYEDRRELKYWRSEVTRLEERLAAWVPPAK